MELSVYLSQSSVLYVLVPAPAVPSPEAEQFYGPLRLLTTVRLRADAGGVVWQRAADQINSHAYAVISTAQTSGLFEPALEAAILA